MRIVTIVGTRPQFIKAAPVSRAIGKYNRQGNDPQITEVLVHTGQHYDYNMSQTFFDELKIRKPTLNLGVGSKNHGEMTGIILARVEKVLLTERPDWVLVYGDTNSTLAGALAAAKLNIPVAHVEAGLRSFNREMPEEINRVLTDHISDKLFCPSETAVINLEKEGIIKGVLNVGDVMYDSFLFTKDIAVRKSTILSDLELKPKGYCLCTLHRQENTENPTRLRDIFVAFRELAKANCPFIIPLHPRTRKVLRRHRLENRLSPHIRLLPPLSYLDMITLEIHAKIVLTDSGGVQKEAYFAEVPCITLRDETEWIETLDAGWNYLGGADCDRITSVFQKANNASPGKKTKLFGEGKASDLILHELISNPV